MYESILMPLDGSSLSECALPPAIMLARAIRARLVLLGVAYAGVWNGGYSDKSVHHPTDEVGRSYLARVSDSLSKQGLELETRMAWSRSPRGIADEIAQVAAAQRVRWIVMGTSVRRTWRKGCWSSIAKEVVATSRVPVFLVQPGNSVATWLAAPACRNVLVLLDGSPAAEAALPHAVGLARALRACLVLMLAVPPVVLMPSPFAFNLVDRALSYQCDNGKSYLTSIAQQLRRGGLSVRTQVRIGPPLYVILEEVKATGTAIVVMAADPQTRLERWASGSMATQLLQDSASLLVLVINSAKQFARAS